MRNLLDFDRFHCIYTILRRVYSRVSHTWQSFPCRHEWKKWRNTRERDYENKRREEELADVRKEKTNREKKESSIRQWEEKKEEDSGFEEILD